MNASRHNQAALAAHSRFGAYILTRRPAIVIQITALAAAALSATLCASGQYASALAIAATALFIGFALAARLPVETALITWFVITPVASFFARFPAERSLITFDRAAIACAALLALFKLKAFERDSRQGVFLASRFEIAWALLAALALISAAIKSNDIGYAMKIAVDSFCLPLVAFHLARRHFNPRGRAGALMVAALALAFMMFVTGAFELATGANLFQYKGSELVREGERRVNGPFASDSSFAIICLLLTVFLWMARRALRVRFDKGARIIYLCAIAAATVATLLPLFRAVAAALLVCLVIAEALGRRNDKEASNGEPAVAAPRRSIALLSRRKSRWIIVAALLCALIAAGLMLGSSSLGRRLTSPRNAYGRLATWEAAAKIAIENPLFGVGLANYTDHFRQKYFGARIERESVFNARAIDSPHSNPLWIAAELGLIGFALYAAANVYIFLQGLRAFKRARDKQRRAAAACYIAVALAYLIPGLTLTSGAYSDLNLYLFFLLGLLLNISVETANDN